MFGKGKGTSCLVRKALFQNSGYGLCVSVFLVILLELQGTSLAVPRIALRGAEEALPDILGFEWFGAGTSRPATLKHVASMKQPFCARDSAPEVHGRADGRTTRCRSLRQQCPLCTKFGRECGTRYWFFLFARASKSLVREDPCG